MFELDEDERSLIPLRYARWSRPGPRVGIEATFVERHGSPYTAIVKLADELRADAFVVGASTQAGDRRPLSVDASRMP